MKIGIIGAGNMAKAIVKGMLEQKIVLPEEICVSRRDGNALKVWKEELGVEITADNRYLADKAEILVLAVKPQMMSGVIEEIRDLVTTDQLLISIAAGKTITWFEEQFGKKIKLIRSMPNTPAMVLKGCTAYCKNDSVTAEEEDRAKEIFGSYGSFHSIPESMMDNFGALAGSGPAFIFLLLEALADGAVLNGMPRQMAYEIAASTVIGSGELLLKSGKHPGELKDMVCSPGGTTICGIKSLEERGVRAAMMAALNSCVEKSSKL